MSSSSTTSMRTARAEAGGAARLGLDGREATATRLSPGEEGAPIIRTLRRLFPSIRHRRELQPGCRALACRGFEAQTPAVALGNQAHQEQPQAHAAAGVLGREKGLDGPPQGF